MVSSNDNDEPEDELAGCRGIFNGILITIGFFALMALIFWVLENVF